MTLLYPKQVYKVRKLPAWQRALARLEGAYSDATIKSYRNDVNAFVAWCEANQKRPFPATPKTVAAFVTDRAERYKASTIRRNLSAIAKMHRLLRMEDPVNDEEVLISRRRAYRKNRLRPRQAYGLTRDLVDRMIAACPEDLAGKRNKAIISVGYDTLCRRSEIIALRWEDITTNETKSGQILVRRSKNDPFGAGRTAYLSHRSLMLILEWIAVSGTREGCLFRRVRDNRIGKESLDPSSISRILKEVATVAKLAPEIIKEISSHSLRVGAAQDMMKAGMSVLPIMRAGGWKTIHVVARYVENTDIQLIMSQLKIERQ